MEWVTWAYLRASGAPDAPAPEAKAVGVADLAGMGGFKVKVKNG